MRWIYILNVLSIRTHIRNRRRVESTHSNDRKTGCLMPQPHKKMTFEHSIIFKLFDIALLLHLFCLLVSEECVRVLVVANHDSKNESSSLILMYTCCFFIIINLTLFINRTHTEINVVSMLAKSARVCDLAEWVQRPIMSKNRNDRVFNRE